MIKLHRTQTGISGEYFAAAELIRRGFSIAITMGNTKSIDIFGDKNNKTFKFQVKSIQSKKSISFNLSRDTIINDCFYIFVNLNADTLTCPDFFIMKGSIILKHLNLANSGRDWINLNYLEKNNFKNNWEIIK
jgi:hypothetical protein